MTPFQALYGYEPPNWKDFALHNSKVQAITNPLEDNQGIINLLKENISMACNRMKQQADQRPTEREFKEGDWVFVILQPYKQLSLKQQGNCRIHNTFHVSSLKITVGQNQTAQTEIPETDEEGRIILEPEGILATKEKVLRSKTIKEYLIKWKGLPEEDSLWQTERFHQQHPTLNML
eukprot:PITA_04302